ncbi:MAG: 50S ribosomal protein L6 [Deltaproteobacteria bacterium]|nr:50S ribosomal protein L6 [Deltaproteobacteria bacterium]
MSRIGKQPVAIPDGVKVNILDGKMIRVEGPKGSLEQPMLNGVQVSIDDKAVKFSCEQQEDRQHRARYGLLRSLVANMVTGVKQGFEKALEIQGVGYKAEIQGTDLVLSLGFSESKKVSIPKGINCTVDKNNKIVFSGIDKQAVGQVAAKVRKIKPPEPYQGKGIRYAGEQIKKKVGKTGTA